MKTLRKLCGKKLLPSPILMLLTLSLLSALNVNTIKVSAVESPYIAVVPEITTDLTPGTLFNVSIYTNYGWNPDYSEFDAAGYELWLEYDPNILEGVSVTNGEVIVGGDSAFLPGPFNSTAGELSGTMAFYAPEQVTSMYRWPYASPPPNTTGPWIGWNGTLAHVTFTVVGYGFSDITIGDDTVLVGWNFTKGEEYSIIDAETMPTHIQHGYFDNTGGEPVHDVAVVEVIAPAETTAGKNVTITVKLRNEGTEDESVNVTVSYDTTFIDNITDIVLGRGTSETLQFEWLTPGVTANTTYTITAEVPPVAGEVETADNNGTTLIKLVVRHDVSIKDGLGAPAMALVGELVTINVTVKNQGSYDENVTLKVEYDGHVIGTKNFTLKALTSNTVLFSWKTTSLEPSEYEIVAFATIDVDEDPTNDIEDCRIKLKLGHDVAVGSISAPTLVYVGESATIRVVVENNGGYNETFAVKVTVSYDTTVIETQTENVTLDVKIHPADSVFFYWNTTDVAPGSYNITAEAILAEGIEDANPTDNRKTQSIDVSPPVGAIAGMVTDALTDDPILVANVMVAPGNYATTTNANGHYNITDVLVGTYTVTAFANGYKDSSQTDITVVAGQTTTLNFTLTPLPTTGTIAGIVKDSSTGDPIAGATVTANGMSATTNSSGAYTISDVLVGTYTVTASANGYKDSSQTDITVVAGQTTTEDFELTPTEPEQPLNILLYAGVAAVAIIAIAAIAVYVLKVRKPA